MKKDVFERKVTKEMLNYYDLLHGGEAFKMMDATAGEISRNFVKGRTLTKAANNIEYNFSVYLGETIISSAEIKKVGNTSLNVYVELKVKERDNEVSSSGEFIMVSVDENFNPKPIRDISV
ncbi:hotdog domain-containing protein [Miniphocaeibacter massiliensis]|uniref:hotdog domain-containing protein n=1 Tax=Miniphocaeibacter massiliensis TaxID=2041841 RepID=UPI0013E9F71A|nr:hotdog domain-containing protein [Miniphocaeibacter massiliensis]